jgi:3-hydroxybutyryl-CoA dehydrogenase
LTFEVGLDGLGEADLVIEAVPERLELKKQILTALDDITRPETILATNTSSLSLTDIVVATRNPHRVVGMHFFNPAPVQRLVEVIRTVAVDPQVLDSVVEVARGLGKTVVVAGDRAGFVADGLLFGHLNQAVKMLEERYATREDMDAAMRLGCGLPMGPLALMDLIGLDTAYETSAGTS